MSGARKAAGSAALVLVDGAVPRQAGAGAGPGGSRPGIAVMARCPARPRWARRWPPIRTCSVTGHR